MALLNTAAPKGMVHMMFDNEQRTLCGKAPESRHMPWARWATFQASLEVRQRSSCPKCADAMNKFLKSS